MPRLGGVSVPLAVSWLQGDGAGKENSNGCHVVGDLHMIGEGQGWWPASLSCSGASLLAVPLHQTGRIRWLCWL